MALPDSPDSPGRATVAQTLAELRGLRDFIDARFTDTQRQLDGVTPLPTLVAELKADLKALDERELQRDEDMDRRVTALEEGRTRTGEWVRTHLPTILLTLVIAVVAIATFITQLK